MTCRRVPANPSALLSRKGIFNANDYGSSFLVMKNHIFNIYFISYFLLADRKDIELEHVGTTLVPRQTKQTRGEESGQGA